MSSPMKSLMPQIQSIAPLTILAMVVGCATPATINLGGVSYIDRAASRVELGGLGLKAQDGVGYHHLASANQCTMDIPVSLDLLVEEFPSAIQGFTPPKLKAIAQRYARTRDALKQSSLMGLSIRESDLERWFSGQPSEHCTNLIQRNLEDIRFISSVIVVVQHESIQSSTAERLEIEVRMGADGNLVFRSKSSEEPLFVANATDVIGYRSAHLCWSEPIGEAVAIRVDDARFNPCPLGFSEAAPEGWQRGGAPVTTEQAPQAQESAPSEAAPSGSP